MTKFEIINPSDKAYIEGEFLTCCLAVLLLADGHYGLEEVEGERTMPVFLFGGAKEWFKGEFNIDGIAPALADNRRAIKEALHSVYLAGERTSMTDLRRRAHQLAERMYE